MVKQVSTSRTRAQTRRTREKRERTKNYLILGGFSVVIVVIIGVLLFISRPGQPAAAIGDVVPVGASDHITQGAPPGPYPSDPPAGGKHYPGEYNPGFYSEEEAAKLPKYHEGFLVHNMEHGYIIYWYNCQANPGINCDDLKNTIKQVQKEFNNEKTIAFPWPSLKEPLVMTSWGRIMRLEKPDISIMRQFYRANLNKAPEPDAE